MPVPMTPYLIMILIGFALFIGLLGFQSIRTLVEGARTRRDS